MLNMGQLQTMGDDAMAYASKMQGGHPIPLMIGVAIHLATLRLSQEPFHQVDICLGFGTNYGTSQEMRLIGINFTQAFGFAIDVEWILGVSFHIRSFTTGKHAIRGNLQQSATIVLGSAG